MGRVTVTTCDHCGASINELRDLHFTISVMKAEAADATIEDYVVCMTCVGLLRQWLTCPAPTNSPEKQGRAVRLR